MQCVSLLSQGLYNIFPFYGLCSIKVHVRAHTHTHAQGESQVYVVLIVPSRHVPWWSVEGALFWELHVVLFCDAIHKEILRRVLKKNVQCSRLGVSIHRRCICMAESSVRPQTVQSKEVFIHRRGLI